MAGYEYNGVRESVSDPGDDGFDIVPSDSAALEEIPKYLYVGGAGDLHLKGRGKNRTVVLVGVPAGSLIPFRPEFVLAATTATDIVGIL